MTHDGRDAPAGRATSLVRPEDVTIVVVNWRRAQETIACLESLARATLGGARVLVVDNGSRDGSVDALRARFPAQEILELPVNVGFAGGSNAGIRAAMAAGATGVLLLNNDAEVAPDFLGWLLHDMELHPDCAAVSSIVLRKDRPDMIEVAYSEVRFDRRYVVQLVGVNALPGDGFDTRRPIPVAVMCCLLLRAEALGAIGLLDEAYFAYHEDVDWCLRAHAGGWRILFEPYSRVFHGQSASTRSLRARPPVEEPDPSEPQLPNAEPLQWNPVRTYLGSRNVVRLLRAHATAEELREYLRRQRRALPLELLAVLLGRVGKMRLGHWSYGDAARLYLTRRHQLLRNGALGARVLMPLYALADLCWPFPRDLWHAYREGRLDEFIESVRGLVDGIADRPIPLERLGLR